MADLTKTEEQVAARVIAEAKCGPRIRCCFCGKALREVKKLITDGTRHSICNECVSVCNEILAKEGL